MQRTSPPEQTEQGNSRAALLSAAIAQAVHSLDEPIVGRDLEGTVLFWNSAAERLYGYEAEEMIGQSIDVLVPLDRRHELAEIMERLDRGERIERLETVRRQRDGHELLVSLTLAPIRQASGEVAGAVSITHDVTELRRSADVQRFLAEVGRLLHDSSDPRSTPAKIVRLLVPRFADWCTLEILDPERQVVHRHRDPRRQPLLERLCGIAAPPGGELAQIDDSTVATLATDDEELALLRELSLRSAILAPLAAHGRSLGALLLVRTSSERAYDELELAAVRELARTAALAIDRSTLYRRAEEARRDAESGAARMRRLQSATAALSEAVTTVEVAEVLVGQGVAAVGADGGFVRVLSADARRLEVVASLGFPEDFIEANRSLPVDTRLPSADVLQDGQPRWFESVTAINSVYPEFVGGVGDHSAFAVIPMNAASGPLGVIGLGFAKAHSFALEEQELLLMLTAVCTQSLERARLYERELTAPTSLERARAALEQTVVQLDRERGRLAELVERLHEGVLSVRRDGTLELANRTAARFLELEGDSLGADLPAEWLRFPLREFALASFDADVRREAQVETPDRESAYLLTALPAAGAETALLVLTDRSERARRERVEREFVSNAAHELRTPVTSISVAIDALQAGAKSVTHERDHFLDHIEHESRRLNRLTRSLLLLARVQRGTERPPLGSVELAPMLEEILAGLEQKDGVDVELDCASATVIATNRELLEHAVFNLVANALRYTKRGRVRVAAAIRPDGSAVLEVVDTGPGIAPQDQAHVFERFARLNPQRGDGFGLGLAITQQAVAALDGTIELDSTLGEGTSVTIVLPNAREAGAA